MATWRMRLARVFMHLSLHTNGTGKVVQLAYDVHHYFSPIFPCVCVPVFPVSFASLCGRRRHR